MNVPLAFFSLLLALWLGGCGHSETLVESAPQEYPFEYVGDYTVDGYLHRGSFWGRKGLVKYAGERRSTTPFSFLARGEKAHLELKGKPLELEAGDIILFDIYTCVDLINWLISEAERQDSLFISCSAITDALIDLLGDTNQVFDKQTRRKRYNIYRVDSAHVRLFNVPLTFVNEEIYGGYDIYDADSSVVTVGVVANF